jgi:hypothetical protein
MIIVRARPFSSCVVHFKRIYHLDEDEELEFENST